MKKLFIILTIVLFASFSHAWTLSWNDTAGEDGYIVRYKSYPAGYSYPSNPAPASLIQDMEVPGTISMPITADVTEWNLPETDFTEGSRYVFVVQATQSGSISGYSDHLCWTWPSPAGVLELPLETGADITINIYQAP